MQARAKESKAKKKRPYTRLYVGIKAKKNHRIKLSRQKEQQVNTAVGVPMRTRLIPRSSNSVQPPHQAAQVTAAWLHSHSTDQVQEKIFEMSN
jgi:hypothetical protein